MQFDKQNAHMRYHQTQMQTHTEHTHTRTRAETKAFRNIVLFCSCEQICIQNRRAGIAAGYFHALEFNARFIESFRFRDLFFCMVVFFVSFSFGSITRACNRNFICDEGNCILFIECLTKNLCSHMFGIAEVLCDGEFLVFR